MNNFKKKDLAVLVLKNFGILLLIFAVIKGLSELALQYVAVFWVVAALAALCFVGMVFVLLVEWFVESASGLE